MSDPVKTPENRFSRVAAHIVIISEILGTLMFASESHRVYYIMIKNIEDCVVRPRTVLFALTHCGQVYYRSGSASECLHRVVRNVEWIHRTL